MNPAENFIKSLYYITAVVVFFLWIAALYYVYLGFKILKYEKEEDLEGLGEEEEKKQSDCD